MSVEFYMPLAFSITQEDYDKEYMLETWKETWLKNKVYLDIWNKMEANANRKKGLAHKLDFWISLPLRFLQWFWPFVALVIAPNFIGGWSLFFVICGLVPLQIIMLLFLASKIYTWLCVGAAYMLENPNA